MLSCGVTQKTNLKKAQYKTCEYAHLLIAITKHYFCLTWNTKVTKRRVNCNFDPKTRFWENWVERFIPSAIRNHRHFHFAANLDKRVIKLFFDDNHDGIYGYKSSVQHKVYRNRYSTNLFKELARKKPMDMSLW